METLWQDLRYAVRTLIRNPGFAIVALATLALGIGANSAVFSVVNGVLLRPLPYADPDRLVVVWESNPTRNYPYMFVSPPNFADLRAEGALAGVSAFRVADFTLTRGSEPVRLQGARASAELFSVLGVEPAIGRGFQAEDDRPGAKGVVVLSHGLWEQRFGASPEILGQEILLDSESHTVIGVMPRGFNFPPPISLVGSAPTVQIELWTPFRLDYAAGQRGAHFMLVVGRLQPGGTRENAEARLDTVADRLARDFPETNTGWDVTLVPLHRQVFGNVEPALLMLLAAVGFVLLIACANLANLMLARAAARHREVAVRVALGAGRRRVVRQLLTESGLLSLLGGAAGLLLSYWLVRAVIAFGPRNIPRLGEAGIDATVLAFTLGASVVTAALFGLAPAWQTFNLDLEASLREGGRGASSGRWHKRLSSGLVVAEVALAFLLLVGGGLLFQSFLRLRGTPLGFQPENVVSMSIQLPQATYPDRARRVQFFAELQREAAGLPGVRSASLIDSLPLGSDRQGTSFAIEGKPEPPPGQEQSTNFGLITPGYFETMGISIRRGRDFSSGDTAESPPVVIINERLARQYFPGEEPNGRRLRLGFRGQIFHQIVGVVADERHVRPEADFRPNVYLPYAQSPQRSALTLVLRSETDAATVVAGVSARLRELDPGLPLFDVRTLDRVVSESLAQPRLSAFLFSFFSLVAMGLAAVGIYGVVSYSVSQRFPEFGIRMALGASSRHIFRMILGQGAGLGLVGVVFGLAGALPLSRYLSSLLFEVSPTDPLTFSAIALFLMGVALVACWVPARRASKVEPGISLRYE